MSKFDEFQTEHDTIIVGSTLPALLYAHFYHIPFVSAQLEKPDKFDWYAPEINLDAYNLPRGCPKYQLWDRLYFELGLLGLNLMGEKGKLVRIQDDIVKVPTQRARMGKFKYNNLLVFSEDNVVGLPPFTHFVIDPMYKVIDYFGVKADKHETKEIGRPRHPFESGRALVEYLIIDKPSVAISYCTEQDLTTWEYSETQARFKVMDMLRKADFKGRRNGFDPARADGISRYALKVEHLRRETHKISRNHTYQDTDRVQFRRDTDVDLLKIFSQ